MSPRGQMRGRFSRGAYDPLRLRLSTMTAASWSVVNGTGWEIDDDPSGLLVSCDNSGARDTTGMALAGLVLVDPNPLALDLFDADPAYLIQAQATYQQADLTGLGCGVGIVNSTTAPTRWAARIHRRDGSGTVTKLDESNLQSVSVTTGATRTNTIVVDHRGGTTGVAQTMLWDTDAGNSTIAATNCQGRTQAFAQFDTGTSDSPVYLALFFTVTVASAGSVLVTAAGAHRRALGVLGTAAHRAGV